MIRRKVLKNKPLVEAIFELRWELEEQVSGAKTDPHYKILIGRMYDRVKDDYPYHEELPTATIPDEIAGYIIQHRFRKDKDMWPLIQVGPGIVTLNDTEGYVWDDFEERIKTKNCFRNFWICCKVNNVIAFLVEIFLQPF